MICLVGAGCDGKREKEVGFWGVLYWVYGSFIFLPSGVFPMLLPASQFCREYQKLLFRILRFFAAKSEETYSVGC